MDKLAGMVNNANNTGCHLFSRTLLTVLQSALFFLLPGGLTAALALQTASGPTNGQAETLEVRLAAQGLAQVAAAARERGDAARGALLYFNPTLTCVKCHEPKPTAPRLGPALAEINREVTAEYLVASLLKPSHEFTEGFRSVIVLTLDGRQINGLVVSEDDEQLVIADPAMDGKQHLIAKADVDVQKMSEVSAMPTGLVNLLGDEQQFLDLVRFLIDIKQGGPQAMLRLRPPDSLYAEAPLPDYENDINHVEMIRRLDRSSLQRGEKIYTRYCARCHGTAQQEGTMPSALRFVDGQFKNGNDPLSMYRTLTHGYGLMVSQRWMVPQQKYDVIHFIRKRLIEKSNPSQLYEITPEYLAGLPAGTQFGPEPVERTPWSDMDYGPSLINTYEVGDDGSNIAYKGIAVRLDAGPGGVSQGNAWMLYEHDTMRVAAAWSGQGFIDWNGIHFNDQHQVHPRIVGQVSYWNSHGPGWANPHTGRFDDDTRVVGRDGKRYGPLPPDWCKYLGLYHFDNKTVVAYRVGQTAVLEMPSRDIVEGQPVFARQLKLDSRPVPLLVKIAELDDLKPSHLTRGQHSVMVCRPVEDVATAEPRFDGNHFLVAPKPLPWSGEMTIAARIKTKKGGTIICQTADQSTWVPGGKSLFVRGGRLVFDIGWVGAVTSRVRIDDGQWHTVAMTWRPAAEQIELFIDGQLDRTGHLKFGQDYDEPVVRIGYTADDFPGGQSIFDGEMTSLQIWHTALSAETIGQLNLQRDAPAKSLVAHWSMDSHDDKAQTVKDLSQNGNDATWKSRATTAADQTPANFFAHVTGLSEPVWKVVDQSVCLEIPPGVQPLSIKISAAGFKSASDCESAAAYLEKASNQRLMDLSTLTGGSPRRYPDVLTTQKVLGDERGPFAVDFLAHPKENPWACRMRFTGLDFFDGGDEAAVCAWDGSVWRVSGLLDGDTLRWQRIACGLFQPLGLRIRDRDIFVSCRDQIVVLEDFNGDGETDFYRCFNSDHQVTEHFHEFAMGLQTDAAGNFYYAKSARHAKTPLVPHHGTLLKVAGDGSATDILAVGFRAANGVCLNPDDSFFVTDQEGHWNPKNRINWVTEGGFYGNMWGYHDVVDESDDAMQRPLCWITNEFDRSPGELMWVDSTAWGPLNGALLNLSYGMGQIFVVPHESIELNGQPQLQGGMCSLPIDLFPTGVMRGRFNSADGQLYCCGMYAWAGNRQTPGGFYRVRYTGKPVHLPLELMARPGSLQIKFSGKLDPDTAENPQRFAVTAWDIRRTANYGSPHLNERPWEVTDCRLLDDGQTVQLMIPDLEPTRCMEIKFSLKTAEGIEFTSRIHNTIHGMAD